MIRPLGDRIVVRRLPAVDGPEKIIVAPEVAAKESINRGEIIAVGPGKKNGKGVPVPLDVKPGQIVWFGRYMDYEEDNLAIIQQADIICVEEVRA